MGTSTPFDGAKNGGPLIPSFVGVMPAPNDVEIGPGGEAVADPNGEGPPEAPNQNGEPAEHDSAGFEAPTAHFTAGRTNYTRYAKSKGEGAREDRRAFGRAVRSYVRSAAGGARNVARRMAAEKSAVRGISHLMGGAATTPGGIREFVRTIDFAALADRPIAEIYAALVDYVCPPDGAMEDAYAREAYLEAVAELATQERDLEHPSEATTREFISMFLANAVHHRILIAIGAGTVTMPTDVATVREINASLSDFIRGCVDDEIAATQGVFQSEAFQAQIDDLFERVAAYIDEAADDEAEGRR